MIVSGARRQGQHLGGEPSRSRGRSRVAGHTLVEFALMLPAFAMLLFGVFEFGRVVQSWVTLQHAVDEAARFAVTGEDHDAGAGARESSVVQVARDAATGLVIDDAAGPGEPAYFRVFVRSTESTGDPAESEDAGGPNEFVRVTIDYNHPAVTWLLADRAYLCLQANALVLNERFARPQGAAAMVPVGQLPPTPPPIWTKTPTCTPTSTPTTTPTP